MVQYFGMLPQPPSIWETLGQSLGSGIESGVKMGLSAKMQQMFEDQAIQKQRAYNAKANQSLFGNEYEGIDPKIAAAVHEQQQAIDQSIKIGKYFEKMSGIPNSAEMFTALGPQASAKFIQSGISPLQFSQMLSGESGQGEASGQEFIYPQTQKLAEQAQQTVQKLSPLLEQQQEQDKTPQDAFPQAQPTPPTAQDRFKSVSLFGKPFRVVADVNDPRTTPQEAKEYYRLHSPMTKSDQDYKDWIASQTLEAKKGGLDLKKREAEEKRIEPLRKEIDGLRSKVMAQKGSLDISDRMIRQGNTDSYLQFIGQRYGFTPAESTETSVLNAVQKEFLTGTLGEIGARGLNQFIEQRILSMMALVGRSKEANLSVNESIRYFTDLDREKIRLFDELDGKVPAKDLQKEIYHKLEDYAEKRKEQLSQNLSNIKDEFASYSDLRSTKKVPVGTYLTQARANALKQVTKGDAHKAQELAIKLGYKLP